MKKYLIPALALGLVMTSCQSDEPFAPTEGGEKQVTFTLNVPGELGTRAAAGANKSDKGGATNQGADQIKYTLVLQANNDTQILDNTKATVSGTTATFTPTVVLGREYKITAYASLKDAWDGVNPIAITNSFNDESKDAYFHTTTHNFANGDLQPLTLTRPYGKLRLIAEDYDPVKTKVETVTITYANPQEGTFNATTEAFTIATENVAGTTKPFGYYEAADVTGAHAIFAEYLPAPKTGEYPVTFTVTVKYKNDPSAPEETYSRTFNDIPVKRNALTTLKGAFFTAGANISVVVDEDFDVNMEDVADGVYKDVNDNYYISNANGLKWVAEQVNTMEFYVNQSANIFDNKTVYIVNDIDLGGAEWRPIGDYAFSRTSFNGTFDGQGHTISNFKVTEPVRWTEKVTEASYGFFGNVKGTVKNLTVENATVNPEGGRYSAALVGRLHDDGKVENCHVVTSSVTINHWQVGGLVGQNNNGNIKDCSVTGSTITGMAAVGAIIGMDMTAGEHTIENCRVANTALVQNASFGASYDESYGIAVGLVNKSGIILNLNNVVAENNTIKGVASNKLIGEKVDGAQVNISQVVSTSAALTDALGKGFSVVLEKDIDMGSTQLAIAGENQVVDLGGHVLTTANNWGGISLKNGACIKNGTITHTGNTAAIKAFNGTSVENVNINATCSTADKTVTGIAVQQGANVESIKNVTINGVSQGIEVGYQATVGLIEKAIVNESNNGTAKGIGLVINGGKVGKAKDCTFKGETYGITLHLKGVFASGLELENCNVEGTTASIYAWDEKGISNTSGSLILTYDAATTLTGPFVWDFEDECKGVVTLNRPQ